MGKKRILIVLLLIVSITLIASTKALVIGIGDYRDTTIEQLPGAIEDARAFAEALSRNEDIEVKIRKNLTLSEMNVELSKWSREGEAEDTIILYFAGHGYTLKDEAYLIPSDANSGYIRDNLDKVAYNLAKGLKELSENIRAKEVLIIIDACYSGSLIKGARPLQDVRISEYSIDSLIKEKGYVFLLSSKSNETSGQMDDGRGHFTHYLLKGIEGEANRDNDDKITVKEVYDYLREEVRKATSNNQTPVMVGEREIVIAKDLRGMYDSLTLEIARMAREGRIDTEYTGLYLKILIQKENDDNELEKKVRSYLLNYLKDRNLTSLIAQTTVAMLQPGTTPQTSQQTQSQVTTQPKGNCLLKVIAGNELAKSGSVYLNGIMEGTLEQGVLVLDHLGVGTHKIVLDGEKINQLEKEITFNYDYDARELELKADPATRVIKIVTIPPNAKIWIDGRELSSRSPWQEPVEVGKVYDLEVLLEGYGRETRKINIPAKGDLIPFTITIPEASAPDRPVLTYPSNNSKDIPLGNITLKWESKESDLTYRIEFDGKTYTTKNKNYTVSASERGKTYSWKVTAVNEFGKETTSETYSFTTQSNRAPNTPSNPSPSNNVTNQPLTMTLSWDCSDPDGDILTYDVYFGTSSNPTTKVSTGQSGKSINRSNLSYGTTFYWKVVAKDSKGATTEGPEWRFTTQSNRAPNTPSNPSPSNNATNQPTTITLSWECSDPDGDAVTYDVYFGTSSNSMTKVSSGQTLNRSNLSIGTTYYWKVVAKDSKGATTEGPVWKFTTQSAPTTTSYTPSSIVPQMVLVDKGSFTMGDTWGGGGSDEKPTHKVTFTYDFYIGKYEVTFNEYDAFCNATGRSKPSDSGWGRGTRPVINVSWWDAIAYCNWLSEKEKLPKAYDNNGNLLDKDGRVTTDPSKVVGYRLPTEAEWEYAARGGSKSKGYKYAGSDNVNDVAWYYQNSGSKTQEVGKKAPNELGIYDMSGNVWEWCSDWFGNYSSSAQTNPYNNSGSSRVNRGGSWGNGATYARVALRSYYSPTFTSYYLGFRITRTVP